MSEYQEEEAGRNRLQGSGYKGEEKEEDSISESQEKGMEKGGN